MIFILGLKNSDSIVGNELFLSFDEEMSCSLYDSSTIFGILSIISVIVADKICCS